jgi:protein tyrosine/serine phosphatase
MDDAAYQKLLRRNLKRHARIARWDRPLQGRLGRAKAWLNMLFADHGLFRLAYLNAHPVGSGRLWRSAQPTPRQLARFHRAGIRSVICLRGQREYGSWPLERDTCRDLGIELHDVTVRSREAPQVETVLELKRLFETIRYPALIHCKSGADRAGLAAALYLIFQEKRAVPEAARQLSLRYGHMRSAKTGILYRFLCAYADYAAKTPISFEDWVAEIYDPQALAGAQKPRRLQDFVADHVLHRE